MPDLQTSSKTKWGRHHTVAQSSVSVGRVAGVAFPVPGLGLSLGLSLVVTMSMTIGEGAVRVGGVPSVTTHGLIHCPAHRGGGGATLLSVGHMAFLD